MADRTGIYLTEEDARAKIEEALKKLQGTLGIGVDPKERTDSSSVQYHIDTILKAGGGIWNETIARDYLQNLEAQIGQDIKKPDKL